MQLRETCDDVLGEAPQGVHYDDVVLSERGDESWMALTLNA